MAAGRRQDGPATTEWMIAGGKKPIVAATAAFPSYRPHAHAQFHLNFISIFYKYLASFTC